MVSDWEEVVLGDYVDHQKGYIFKSKDYQDEGELIVRVSDFTDRSIDISSCNRIDKLRVDEFESVKLNAHDVIIATVGSWPKNPASIVGKTVSVPKDAEGALLNQNAVRLRAINGVEQRFLFFLLKNKAFQSYIISTAQGSANQASITLRDIFRYSFKLPPLSEQKAIAHILGSLDDKIELNRQMNETLEAMAQALFKSWFVDFDPVIDNALAAGNAIPDEFAERAEQRKTIEKKDNADIQKLFPDAFEFTEEMGWIPLGWDVDGFKNIVEKYIDNRGKTPPLSEFGIPLIEVKHISDYEIKPSLDTTKFVDRDTYNSWFRSYLQTDDIIISTVGTIGRICMVANGKEFAIAQNLLGFRFKKTSVLPSFMYYQMDGFRFRHDVDARLVTTVQASIKRKDLETISLLIPSIKVQKAFEIIVKPLMNKQNSNQNIQLAKLRDILLPKLMSGELRIPDAEVLVENV